MNAECPVCGSIVRLMAWKHAGNVSDSARWQRTDRLVRHTRDGRVYTGQGARHVQGPVGYDLDVCPGSYGLPGHREAPHVANVPPTPKDRSHLREPLPFVAYVGYGNASTPMRTFKVRQRNDNPWFLDTWVAQPPRAIIDELRLDPLAVDWDEAEDFDDYAPMRTTRRAHHGEDDCWQGPPNRLPQVN